MRHPLTIHPAFKSGALRGLAVEVARPRPDVLSLRYLLAGAGDAPAFASGAGARTDELWRHTCFEAFVQAEGGDGYRELNLAPSGDWAAYRFDGYREGMANAAVGAPEVKATRQGDTTELLASWALDLPADAAWRVGVTAVIEDAAGGISYWSLKHPAGKPDFHNAEGRVLTLPPPAGSWDLKS